MRNKNSICNQCFGEFLFCSRETEHDDNCSSGDGDNAAENTDDHDDGDDDNFDEGNDDNDDWDDDDSDDPSCFAQQLNLPAAIERPGLWSPANFVFSAIVVFVNTQHL